MARLLSAAHGGQVLLSLATQELVRDQLPAGTSLRDLGEHRLKDLFRPERVFQVVSSDLPSAFPPLRTLDRYPNNLPPQPTALIGREKEISEVCERLSRPEVRHLTLTGVGGTGKTRLGLQVAAELTQEFEDGVFFVSLAAISDPELVLPAVAGALGVMETGGQPLMKSLEDYLREKRMLLLLDNFEQVLEAAPVVSGLIWAAPGLKVLVTSRIPLRLYGEHEYAVAPLALPDLRRTPSVERLTQYEAVRLFVDRAEAVKADFEVTNDNAPAVAEICHRLDGLPLAIELAAARVRILPPQKMLRRLSDRLKLLKGGARDLPTRQQTLRRTMDWSYDLLKRGEKALFERLSVFSGGRTLEAVEEICDPEGDIDALDGVESLVEKSLLGQEEGAGGEPRFYMLETVHEYAREKLEESGEAESTSRAHARYFLTLAEEAEPELKAAQQKTWLERLEAEHDNMRAALSWALEREEAELALRLGGALSWFWWTHGHYTEGRRWLEEALAIDGHVPSEARALALYGVAALAEAQLDLDRAQEACEEGLDLLAGEARERSAATLLLLTGLGWVALDREDLRRATEFFEESLALSREQRDTWGLAGSLMGLATVSHSRGDLEKAIELFEGSMRLSRERGDKHLLALCLNNLGMVVYSQGDLGRATELSGEAVELLKELGDRAGAAVGLCNLGWLALLREDLEEAEDFFREGLVLGWEFGRDGLVQNTLEGFACLAGARGEVKRVAWLWGAAQVLHEVKGIPRDTDFFAEADARISRVRSDTTEEAWEEALEEGRAMSFEEAVSYAMEGEEEQGR